MILYDLTQPLNIDTPVFPGDPIFEFNHLCSLDQGDLYNLKYLHFCNHAGTHIDFPAHVIKHGKVSSDYTLDSLIGPGVLLEHDGSLDGRISEEFLKRNDSLIRNTKIVFFKNPENILLGKSTYLDKKSSELLVEYGVKIIGVESLSVDAIDSDNLSAHNILLSNDVLIVENLKLKHVPIGRGEIMIVPLNIPDMDGLPVRVILRR